MRAYPHSDPDTMLTILGHDDVSGLQVLLRGRSVHEDRWVDVPAVEGAIVIQIGQMLQRWTNDAYLATPHRVLLPEAAGRIPARTCLSCFFRPGLQTPIAVPERLAEKKKNEAGEIYASCTVEDFLQMPQTDPGGNLVKLTSDILKDGRWVGARPGSVHVKNAAN